jgi:hypothetical protein
MRVLISLQGETAEQPIEQHIYTSSVRSNTSAELQAIKKESLDLSESFSSAFDERRAQHF